MIEKLRLIISIIFVIFLILLMCVSDSQWEEEESFIAAILFLWGTFLVGIASLGRLWCSLYIAGYKKDALITQGPYSMCRNPLYFFSLLGAVGVGLTTETILIPTLILIAFVMYYPFVIKSEEAEMMKLHKHDYAIYLKKVPSFFPRISLLQEPEEYITKPKIFRNHIFSALWFVWLLGITELMESLHDLKILPSIFKIY
jgi:protein-S-isoprenylcysteine O-methyltransferase Ste14